MTLRVGVDARLIHWPGIGRYISLLLEGLAQRSDIRATALISDSADSSIPEGIARLRVTAPPFSMAEQLQLWRTVSRLPIDVFHSPHFNVPVLGSFPVVTTVHDAAPLRYPPRGIRGIPRRLYASLFYSAVGWRSSVVLTDSAFSKAEISSLSSIDAKAITTVHIALDPAFLRHADSVTERHEPNGERDGSRPYVLYVGTNKPWKNLEVAVRGADEAATKIPGLRLIIAGKQAGNQEPLSSLLDRIRPSLPVEIVGTITDEVLAVLYRDALSVLCPSLYEGFGLTGLEAMACGAPVIHSGAASLPEVLGDAALTADPHSPTAWASAIQRIAGDRELRNALAQAGRLRARHFSVEKMTAETVRAYRQVAESR